MEALTKINYLTEEQYQNAKENGELNENEIYMTPDGNTFPELGGVKKDILWVGDFAATAENTYRYMTIDSNIYDYDMLLLDVSAGTLLTDKTTVELVVEGKGIECAARGQLFYLIDSYCFTFGVITDGLNQIGFKVQKYKNYALGDIKLQRITGIKFYDKRIYMPAGAETEENVIQEVTTDAVGVTTATTIQIGQHTIPSEGIYLITGNVPLNHYGQSGRSLHVQLKKNGAEFFSTSSVINTSAWTVSEAVSYVAKFAKGDLITMHLGSSAAVNWSCGNAKFQFTKLR